MIGATTILTGWPLACERVARSCGSFRVMRGESAKRKAQRVAGWAVVIAIFACSGDRAPQAAEEPKAPEVATVESTLAVMPAPGGACPTYGLWQACNVEERISRAGLAVNRRENGIKHDFMRVEGLVWETSRAEVQVFLYASEEDRMKDTGLLDTVFVSPPGKRIMWRWPATLVTSGNLAAIILSQNGRQSERIALALGAGLPAAPR